MIRVVIADDHPMMRAGIRSFLDAEADLDVVAEAVSGEQAIAFTRQYQPDVLLLDMEMPDTPGVKVAQAVSDDPDIKTRILALSAYNRSSYVEGLLRTGAAGYITKDKPPTMIVEAVRAVAGGEGRWFVTPFSADETGQLTDREREVLQLMAQGTPNEQIAEDLHIAVNTVRNHVNNIYDKLGVHSSREAVAWAWQHGLAAPE